MALNREISMEELISNVATKAAARVLELIVWINMIQKNSFTM